MTIKVLIAGSSHVAAVKMGWDQIKDDFRNISFDFLAASRKVFRLFDITEDGQFGLVGDALAKELHPSVAEGMERLNGVSHRQISDYSHLALVGVETGIPRLLRIMSHTNVDQMRMQLAGASLLSRACFDALCSTIIEEDTDFQLLDKLDGRHVAMIGQPLLTDTVGREDLAFDVERRKHHSKGVTETLGQIMQHQEDACLKRDATFLRQPAETITTYGTTKRDYNRDNAHLVAGPPRNDPFHMNAKYGALVCRQIIEWAECRDQSGS